MRDNCAIVKDSVAKAQDILEDLLKMVTIKSFECASWETTLEVHRLSNEE